MANLPVIFVENSNNSKILGKKGKVSTTYASIDKSCPKSCSLKNECYASYGMVGFHVRKLNAVEGNYSPRDIARLEYKLIRDSFGKGRIPQDGAQGGRDLRIHVAGEARTSGAARFMARAGASWYRRGGGKVWSYTHAWQTVPRKHWGKVSILGSANTLEDIPKILAQGYAPTIVVSKHESPKAKMIQGVNFIPCPAQTKGIGCADCRLCLNADGLLARKAGISFEAHGVKTKQLKSRLKILGQ
jgi:hypothetical protein